MVRLITVQAPDIDELSHARKRRSRASSSRTSFSVLHIADLRPATSCRNATFNGRLRWLRVHTPSTPLLCGCRWRCVGAVWAMLPRTGSHMNALEPLSSRARRAAVKVARGPADGLLAEVRRATTRLFAGVRRGVLRRRSSASNHHLFDRCEFLPKGNKTPLSTQQATKAVELDSPRPPRKLSRRVIRPMG